MKRIFCLFLILALSAAVFGQTAVKEVEKSGDSTVVKTSAEGQKLSENIGKTVATVVVEALDEADIDDETPRKIRAEREIFRGAQCEAGDEECGAGGNKHMRKGNREGRGCGHSNTPMMVGRMICKTIAGIVFLIMWIITLAVIGKGFKKIARAIEQKKE